MAEWNPETFSVVAVGCGSLLVAVAAVAGMLLTNRSNRKNREQQSAIAKEQADALKLQAHETSRIAEQAHEIKVSIDGRMDELLDMTRELAKARAEAVAEAAAKVLASKTIVSEVSQAIVERVGESIDRAANTTPGSQQKEQ